MVRQRGHNPHRHLGTVQGHRSQCAAGGGQRAPVRVLSGQTGRNYITVRGFTLRNAATPWAPPTVEQIGLIGVIGARAGSSKTTTLLFHVFGITLGNMAMPRNQNSGSAKGYVTTIERGLKNGWNKETIGHHVVRNNRIAHCEQAGIVGSLGAVFSTVSGNTIHDIHVRQLFSVPRWRHQIPRAHRCHDQWNHIYRTCAGIWLTG